MFENRNNNTGYNAYSNTAVNNFANDVALSWDAVPNYEATPQYDSIKLADGVYAAQIDYVENQQYAGSTKMPACPMAVIHAHIDTPQGRVEIKNNLFLLQSFLNKIKFYLEACGINPQGKGIGQALKETEGKTARVEIYTRSYTGNDGNQHESWNNVKKWLAQSYQNSQNVVSTPQNNGYTGTQQTQMTSPSYNAQPAYNQPQNASQQWAQQVDKQSAALGIDNNDLPF